MNIVFYILASFSIFFLLIPTFEVFLSLFFKEKKPAQSLKNYDFACIITAYKNIDIAKPLVQSLLQQDYDQYLIYLVADACDTNQWDLEADPLILLQPESALNLKAKSIIYAVENFCRPHDYIIIFDADNLAHPQFLKVINNYVSFGYKAIQGQRTAKNLDSTYACLDATGEFYKNYIERYLPPLLGSSAVISGSGMAVESELYKSYLYGPEIQKGKERWKKMLQEDKILQNHLLDQNKRIVFAWDAIIYDEKVSTVQAIETQRSRWLYSYFQNTQNAIRIFWKGLINFQFNQFCFGLITISPPLFIQVLLTLILSVIALWINPVWSYILITAIAIFGINVLLTLYLSKVPRQIWLTLWAIPIFVFKQITASFKMGNPNKNFKHSEHNHTVSIDEVLGKDE